MGNILSINNLRVRFRTDGAVRAFIDRNQDPYIDAVLDVSLSIERGETLGLVGESGSGKTTIGRSIIRLVDPAGGTIMFEDEDIGRMSSNRLVTLRKDISMMFQDPVASLSPRKTVGSLILEPFKIHGIDKINQNQKARELIEMVGLNEAFLGAYPHQLSGGQARRVGVARALALNPKLVIADEPTAGLDVSVQGEILNLMRRLQVDRGLSYLIITHNLPVIRHLSNHLAIIYLGRVIEIGSTKDIFTNPAHPYTLGLLSAVPQPDPNKRREKLKLEGELPSLSRRPTGCEFHTRCPFAVAKCLQESPIRQEIEPRRFVSCHFPFPLSQVKVQTA